MSALPISLARIGTVLALTAGVLSVTGDPASAATPFVPGAGAYTVDTTALTLTGPSTSIAGTNVGGVAVFSFSSVDIGPGVTITATGSRPFQVTAVGSITVAGTITGNGASASNGSSVANPGGPGGGAAGASGAAVGAGTGGGGVGSTTSNGGGGGGFGGAGAAGGIFNGTGTGGTAGATYGNLNLALQAGSGGAGGSSTGGGGGGGAIALVGGSVTITPSGVVSANGGDGAGGSQGGSGGGSGGAVLLHGDSVAVDGAVSALGGAGGGGGCCGDGGGGGGGRISLEYRTLLDVTGTVGADGGSSGSAGPWGHGGLSPNATGGAGVVWQLTATSPSIGASTTVNTGAALSATTVLKDLTTGAAVSGATVQLYRRTSPAGAWALLATRTTSGTGAASAPVPTTANAEYQWRFGGSSTRQASSSAVQSVTARFVVNLSAKATTVVHGHSVTLYGTVKPVSLGQTVTLQRLVGTTWTNTLTTKLKVQTLPNGVAAIGYVFTRAQPAAGTFRYRVVKAAAPTLAAGTSAVVTVKVT